MECFIKVDFSNKSRIEISLVRNRKNILVDEPDDNITVKQITCDEYNKLRLISLSYSIPVRWDAINYNNKDSFIIIKHPVTDDALLIDSGFLYIIDMVEIWYNDAMLEIPDIYDILKDNEVHLTNKSFDVVRNRLAISSMLVDSPNELPDSWSICVKCSDDSFVLLNQDKTYKELKNIVIK